MKLKRTLIASVLLSSIAFADEPGGLLVTVGGSLYQTQRNEFNLPVSYGSGFFNYQNSSPSSEIGFSDSNIKPEIGVQYRLEDSNVILGGSLSYIGNHNSLGNSVVGSTGYYWRLAGGESPENDVVANYIDSEYVHEKQSTFDSQIYIKIQEYYINILILTPKFGIGFTENKESYGYVVNGRMYGPTNSAYTTNGNQVLSTDYVGPVFGLKVEYKLTNRFDVFADSDVSVLYSHSHMTSEKTMSDSTNGPTEYVNDSKNKLDGRYRFTAGFDFITDTMFPDYSPKITVFAGVDVWQYSPDIVNPNSSNDQETHIESRTSFNKVAGIAFKLPIN